MCQAMVGQCEFERSFDDFDLALSGFRLPNQRSVALSSSCLKANISKLCSSGGAQLELRRTTVCYCHLEATLVAEVFS
jgi:hypothetical protein